MWNCLVLPLLEKTLPALLLPCVDTSRPVAAALPPPQGMGAPAMVLGQFFHDSEKWKIAKRVPSQVPLHRGGLSYSNSSCYFIVFALILLVCSRMNLLFSDRLPDACQHGEIKFGKGLVGTARDW